MPATPLIDYAQALQDLADQISDANEAKGFWDPEPYLNEFGLIAVKIDLIGNEAAEAMDVYRDRYDDDNEDPVSFMTPMQEDDFLDEIADVIIRSLDLAGGLSLDIGNAVITKLQKNLTRPVKHGKRF